MTPVPFALTSPAFASNGSIPRRYTCDGPDVSPPLAWAGAPDGTAALALIVDDPDANGFIHWVVADLPGAVQGALVEGASGHLAPAIEGRNGFGRIGYGGPCPPSGTHHYRFTLLALSVRLSLSTGATAAQVRSAANDRTLATTVLIGTYHR